MYITRNDFNTLKKAVELLPHEEQFNNLTEDQKNIIIKADAVLIELLKKRKKDNKRQAAYIAEKRKTYKNYAR